jgi:hypothetical protein
MMVKKPPGLPQTSSAPISAMARRHCRPQRRPRFRPPRLRVELSEDGFEWIKPRRERKSLIVEFVAQISGERGGFSSAVSSRLSVLSSLTAGSMTQSASRSLVSWA